MTPYLQHYGIDGMKWGVRRFQNADGSLTDEGRKRYSQYERSMESRMSGNKLTKRGKAKQYDSATTSASKIYSKGLRSADKDYRKAKKTLIDKESKELLKEDRKGRYNDETTAFEYANRAIHLNMQEKYGTMSVAEAETWLAANKLKEEKAKRVAATVGGVVLATVGVGAGNAVATAALLGFK